jgi:hypothetical protein
MGLTFLKLYIWGCITPLEGGAIAALAGTPNAGIITAVQMAKPPWNFNPTQIAFHVLDRAYANEFKSMDYGDLNFVLVWMCGLADVQQQADNVTLTSSHIFTHC